ncbi:MAG TPA: penicillin-binding protein 2 [Candidatus Limnocylindrales bacterium]
MSGRTDSRGRLVVLLSLMLVGSLLLVGRTAYWQVLQHERLATLAQAQTELHFSQASRRGTIYDRTGTVILATTLDRYRLIGAPNQLTPDRRASVASSLVGLLGLTGDATTGIAAKMSTDTGYVVLADAIDESTATRIREALADGSIAAVTLEPQPLRSYPLPGGGDGASLAAQVLGFVNSEGQGQYGVEQAYQAQLAGEPRDIIAQRDAAGRPVYGTEEVVSPGVAGTDISLTIDAALQSAVEQEVFAAWVADKAKDVSAVVMDPFTGEIYADATYPSYDANTYKTVAAADPGRFVDPVISEVYEPGSVFKMLTATAALTDKVVTPTTLINDTGSLTLDGGRARISDADRKAMGSLEFQDGIAYSRNVVAARVAMKLGKTTRSAATVLYDTWTRLGFGRKTGVDLAGEVDGIVKDPQVSEWRQIDLANGSFGQSVAVTPMQLATAYAAMMNGGMSIKPHVVRAIGDNVVVPEPGSRVIDPAVSTELVGLMHHVVTTVPFYRDRTLVPGYFVGGKTGTAQIWDTRTHDWKPNIFDYSFVGYIGKTAPRLVVAIRISEGTPTVNRVGFIEMPVMSFELFRRIATDSITMLDLPPAETSVPTTADR